MFYMIEEICLLDVLGVSFRMVLPGDRNSIQNLLQKLFIGKKAPS